MGKRNCRGSVIAETPGALWLLFVLFLVPFIDLATVMLRYTFVVSASRDAAHAASKAKTFSANLSTTDLSARNAADTTGRQTAAAFSEITVSSVTTAIVSTDLSTQVVTRRSTPLTAPADTSLYLYEYETTVSGQINPLITFTVGPFPSIPGLSAPVAVAVTSREFVENPQGLNQ